METVACPDCDLLQHIPPLPPAGRRAAPAAARPSPRSQPIRSTCRSPSLTAAIIFIVANAAPLMGLSAVGRYASTTIIGGTFEMWQQGEEITAMIVAFCAVIAPGIYILFMLTILHAVRRLPAPHWVGEMLRWAQSIQPWSMYEVMMLGILVALIKIRRAGKRCRW